MTALTRRRSNDPHREVWHVLFDVVVVGHIGRRGGVPVTASQCGWSVGFYPGCEPGQHRTGVADTFEAARTGFEADWHRLLPQLPETAFEECRRSRALHAWKETMWEFGCRLPTQETSGRSRCFCGEVIGLDCEKHVYACHMDVA